MVEHFQGQEINDYMVSQTQRPNTSFKSGKEHWDHRSFLVVTSWWVKTIDQRSSKWILVNFVPLNSLPLLGLVVFTHCCDSTTAMPRPWLRSQFYRNYSQRTKGNCPKPSNVRRDIICSLSQLVPLSNDTNNRNWNHSRTDILGKPTFNDRFIGSIYWASQQLRTDLLSKPYFNGRCNWQDNTQWLISWIGQALMTDLFRRPARNIFSIHYACLQQPHVSTEWAG